MRPRAGRLFVHHRQRLGFINVLRLVWTRELTAETYRVIAVGSAESLVPTLVGFASLTAAWLLVAVGMGRQGARL